MKGGFPVVVIGEQADLTYPYTYLGAGPQTLATFVEHPSVKMERPIVLVGQGALARADGLAVLALAAKAGAAASGWDGLAVLHTAAARVGGLDLGFVPGQGGLDAASMTKAGALDVLVNLGADEIDVEPGAFVVYQGTHGDRGAARADVVLPGSTYTEKSGTYVNTEGRVQQADRANFPPGEAREDWAILRALSDALGVRLPFDSLTALRARLATEFPHFARIDAITESAALDLEALRAAAPAATAAPFHPAVRDFYSTNPIARASAVMAECSALSRSLMRAAAE
jgi:NADH-quinone oxidoreductase subunit G